MKEILETLNKNGYEAYIVGGYVRDYLLGIPSKNVDICTNAPINKIISMFEGRGKAFPQYFAYHILDGEYEYDITTYRKELRYKRNKPVELKIAKTLGEDLLRRDFTINTFAMNREGLFVDLLGSKKDLDAKLIKCVGKVEKKFTEDKTRIIRALRFACTLDFDLSSDIVKFISENGKLLDDVPREYKRKELDRIFDSVGVDKFLYYVRRFDMQECFNIKFDRVVHAYNKYGIWAQIETDLPFSNHEKRTIKSIKDIMARRNISINDIRSYDDEITANAAIILNQMEKFKVLTDINKLHSFIDLDIDVDKFFDYVPLSEIEKTYRLVERRVVEGYLANNEDDIIEFLEEL